MKTTGSWIIVVTALLIATPGVIGITLPHVVNKGYGEYSVRALRPTQWSIGYSRIMVIADGPIGTPAVSRPVGHEIRLGYVEISKFDE